jgi:3-oxoacyl-[acyl-carrier-protein] synthase-3
MCLDFFHGCPGWVVGLNGISHIVSRGEVKRVLYFVGDAVTYINPVADREFAPLFGDAGSVTALEFDENAQNLYFNIITKSSDGGALIRREGGIKHPFTAEAYRKYLDWKDRGIKQDDTKPAMDGMDVFSFSITTVPKSMKRLCENYQIDINTVDKLVLHQANKMIVEAIAKRLKVDLSKVPMSLKKYGNTTQVSIPLTIVSQCSNEYKARSQKTLACAFGAGLASAAVYFETDKIVCPEIIVY